LSDSEVYLDQFALTKGMKHLTLSEWSDIFVIAPATANIIGKAASGIGDDLLSTTLLSYGKPVLFVPAMDQGMWDNVIVQKNVTALRENGVYFLEPGFGALASGKVGRGRFPSVSIIICKIMTILEKHKGLAKMNFLVTGGRTEEDLDPARVVTNRSTGMMGAELLRAIYCRDGNVRGIFGEVICPLPEEIKIWRVRTSGEMLSTLKEHFAWCDCLIMAAAVGDYRPKHKSATKIHDATCKFELEKSIDILGELTKHKDQKMVIGFSLEDKNQLSRAREKMAKKKLDLVVLNSSIAVGNARVKASILRPHGKPIVLKELTKWQLANRLLDECLVYFTKRRKG
jgi:phosphopantothenoylcysteine decarboxylase/phosphopantothenate--cysteine ligase